MNIFLLVNSNEDFFCNRMAGPESTGRGIAQYLTESHARPNSCFWCSSSAKASGLGLPTSRWSFQGLLAHRGESSRSPLLAVKPELFSKGHSGLLTCHVGFLVLLS